MVASDAAGLVLCGTVAPFLREQLGGAALRQVHHTGPLPQEFRQ